MGAQGTEQGMAVVGADGDGKETSQIHSGEGGGAMDASGCCASLAKLA